MFRGYMKNFLRQSSLTLLIFGLLLTAALILADRHVCRSTSDRILTYEEAADVHPDCILVLGAGVRGNIPSPMLEDRLKTGIALYQNGTADRLLMSGDHGRKDYDEVNVMKTMRLSTAFLLQIFLWIMPVFLHTKACIAPVIFLAPVKLLL